MKAPLIYGTIMAVAGALLSLLMYLAGLHDTAEKMKSAQWVGMAGGLLIAGVCLTLAMRDRRAARAPHQEWGYGSALGAGVLTGLVAAVVGCIFGYLYFAVINPQLSDVIFQMQVEKMEAAGASSSQIEQVEPMLRKWMTPGVLTVSQAFSGFVMAVLLSLILAIFQRNRPSMTEAPMPPPLAT